MEGMIWPTLMKRIGLWTFGKWGLEYCTVGACTKDPEVISLCIRGDAKDIQSKQKMKARRMKTSNT